MVTPHLYLQELNQTILWEKTLLKVYIQLTSRLCWIWKKKCFYWRLFSLIQKHINMDMNWNF